MVNNQFARGVGAWNAFLATKTNRKHENISISKWILRTRATGKRGAGPRYKNTDVSFQKGTKEMVNNQFLRGIAAWTDFAKQCARIQSHGERSRC